MAGTPPGVGGFHHPSAKIAYVQRTETINGAPGTSVNAPPFSPTSGNLIICWIEYDTTGTSIASVSDSNFNSYTRVAGYGDGILGHSVELWYANNITGGSNITITATTLLSLAVNKSISCHEYVNAQTTAVLDNYQLTTGSGTAAQSNTLNLAGPRELIFTAVMGGGSITAGVGQTSRSSLNGDLAEDYVVQLPYPQNAKATNLAGGEWVMISAAFRSK